MNEREAIGAVGGVAAGQWGMFTTAQAKQVDVSGIEVARLVSRGLVRRVRHGVHAMVGVPSDQFEDVRAEWLATDPGRTAGERQAESDPVVVSHETAAHMQGFGEDLPSGGVHLTSTRRIQTRQPFVIIHRRSLVAPEIIWRDGLPLTSPRRTIEDIVSSGRWEHDHLVGLVSDAINRDLILRSEIAKSPVLIEAVPELGPSPSHTAVRQRLTNAARARGAKPQDTYNAFFRMVFMAVLNARGGWVLKGGTHLLCRLPMARATMDLDMFREGHSSAAASAEALRELMNLTQVGRYTFRVGPTTTSPDRGEIDVARVTITVLDDTAMVQSFSIDISGEVVLNAEPEVVEVPRGDQAVLPGYPATVRVRLYPIENQIADKLCAMYATYGAGRPSTRYRDLYDLALILENLPFDREILSAALTTQQGLRHVTIPEDFGEPAPGWAADYDKQMGRTPSAREPFTTYAAAMASLRTALNPAA